MMSQMDIEGSNFPPPTPNPYAFAPGGIKRVSRTRAAGNPGILLFLGRCSACNARLSRIYRSGSQQVRFTRDRPLVAIEVLQPLSREEAQSHLDFYEEKRTELAATTGVAAQELLERAIADRDMARVHELSAVLIGESAQNDIARHYAVVQEVEALSRALSSSGDDVFIPRIVTAPRGRTVDRMIPEDCIEDAIACVDCECSTDDPIPTASSVIEVSYMDHRPTWPTSTTFYGTDRSQELLTTGKVTAIDAIAEERVHKILTAAAHQARGELTQADELIGQHAISDDEWKLVTRRSLRRQPWRTLRKEVREHFLHLTSGEPLISPDLPKQIKDLMGLDSQHKDPDDAIQAIDQCIRDWEYPYQNVRKETMERLRSRLGVNQSDALPEWTQDFLRQWRNPTPAAKLIINGLVTQDNYQDRAPTPGEKLRTLLGRFSVPNKDIGVAQTAWIKAGGTSEPPKKFMDLVASAPDHVIDGINRKIITSRNFHTLGGEFGSWSRAVQLYSGLKIQCNGLDPTLDSQTHFFKARQNGTHSASVKGWVKDFLIQGKMSPTVKLALLLKGEATEDNYRSLFRQARGSSTSSSARTQPKQAKQQSRTKRAELQPSRAGAKRGAVRTYADTAKMDRNNEASRSSSSDRSDVTRLLDMFTSFKRDIEFKLERLEHSSLGGVPRVHQMPNLRYDPRSGAYRPAD